jgi:hypothetical protein
LSFQDETYDFHEEIQLSTTANSLDVETSLTASDDDYKSGVYLELQKDAITYEYAFDESINISTATTDEPLEIDFLGKTLVIESVTDSDTFTVRVGEQYTLSVDESVTVEGKTVTLKNVFSSGAVLVDVNGVSATVSQSSTKTINGIKVKPIDYGYSDTKTERIAVMLIGDETTKTYNNGDPYIGEDEDDPLWIWKLASLTSSSPTLGVENDFVKDDYSDGPITLGGCYELPNKYAKVCLDSLTTSSTQKYEITVENGVDLSDAGSTWGTSNTVLSITSPGAQEGILQTVGTDARTDTVYLKLDSTNNKLSVFYVDTDNNVVLAGNITVGAANVYSEIGQINFEDTDGGKLVLDVANSTTNLLIVRLNDTEIENDHLYSYWTTSTSFVNLGTNADDSDSDELKWGATPSSIGTKDEDLRTKYGVVIRNPDTNGASDKVSVDVPGDQVKAKVVVYGPGGSSSTTESGKIKQVVPVTTAVAKLDTEISDPKVAGKHLVLVGGPAVNKLTAQALGLTYPTYGSSGLLPFASGEGYVSVLEDKFTTGQNVVIVAGWEAANTRMATSLLQQYSTFAAELGTNTAVKVTSLSSSGITPA